MKKILSEIKNWINGGSAEEKVFRTIIVIGGIFLILYGLGYAIGKCLFYLGF